MDDKAKADLEKLETLREQALCGPEEEREEAQRAYEEFREKLFNAQQCGISDETSVTKALPDVSQNLTTE